jgi:hypothetical protein
MPRGEGADECDQKGRLLAPFSDGQGVGQQGTFVKGLHADDIRHSTVTRPQPGSIVIRYQLSRMLGLL